MSVPSKAPRKGFASQVISALALWFSPSSPLLPYQTSPPASSSGSGADFCPVRDTEGVGSVPWELRVNQGQASVTIHDIRASVIYARLGCTGDPHGARLPPRERGVLVSISFSHEGRRVEDCVTADK